MVPHHPNCVCIVCEEARNAAYPPVELVTVRIAVAISPEGRWRGYGADICGEVDAGNYAASLMSCESVTRVVEAQIPLPKPQQISTIKGKVVE